MEKKTDPFKIIFSVPTWEFLPAHPDDSTAWGIIMGAGAQALNHLLTKTIQLALEPLVVVAEILEVIFNSDVATFGDTVDNVIKVFMSRIVFFALFYVLYVREFVLIMYKMMGKLLEPAGLVLLPLAGWKGLSQLLDEALNMTALHCTKGVPPVLE
jgi:hypothetical protein